jgi:spore maturation protein CgeB
MVASYNKELERALEVHRPDILWVDKGMFVRHSVVRTARQKVGRLIHYSPDNYFLRQNTSRHLIASLALFDVVVTTKTGNVVRLKEAGARRVMLSGNAFDPEVHRPVELSEDDRREYECDISFIGRWEPLREAWLNDLMSLGFNVAVRGFAWDRARRSTIRKAFKGAVLGLDYAKAINAAQINLAFLSRTAQDSITQRSVEIPACGAFMLAERTQEHLDHFQEDVEAVYFNGIDELKSRVEYYLQQSALRRRIGEAGRQRCLSSGYSYDARLQAILDEAVK